MEQKILSFLKKAVTFHQTGKFKDAYDLYQKVLKKNPKNADALHLSGLAAQEMGEYDEAVKNIQKAIKISPKNPTFNYNLGLVYFEQKNYQSAIKSYEKAVKIKPDYFEALNNIGMVYNTTGNFNDAVIYFKKALEIKPDYSSAMNNLGTVYKQTAQYEKALEYYKKAVLSDPKNAQAHNNLADIYKDKGQLDDAFIHLKKAIEMRPDYIQAYNNLGVIYKEQTELKKALDCFKYAIEIKPDFFQAHSNYLRLLNYFPDTNQSFIFEEHKKFGQICKSVPVYKNYLNSKDLSKKLCIGYVSPDFKRHSVAFFIESILKHHDSNSFKIICYSNVSAPDEITERLQLLAHEWKNIYKMDDNQICEMIYNDKVDILIDLAGHTRNNSLTVFAQKPAPVQVTYLGYPNTTGLKTIDYRLTDIHSDPIEFDKYYTEKQIRIPGGFLCFQPEKNSPIVKELPAIKNNYITFGSFNHISKINETLIKIWSKILLSVPDSKLILKSNAFNDPKTKEKYIKFFEDNEVSTTRLTMTGLINSLNDHLDYYNKIDISLDTFPYNGTTTSLESLWMGVPFVALNGNTHASRVGVSILKCIGFDDFIADSKGTYIAKAVFLSKDLQLLSKLRNNLRNILLQSNLMNPENFVKNLENIYKKMWQNYLSL